MPFVQGAFGGGSVASSVPDQSFTAKNSFSSSSNSDALVASFCPWNPGCGFCRRSPVAFRNGSAARPPHPENLAGNKDQKRAKPISTTLSCLSVSQLPLLASLLQFSVALSVDLWLSSLPLRFAAFTFLRGIERMPRGERRSAVAPHPDAIVRYSSDE